jgi:hypothetical protein
MAGGCSSSGSNDWLALYKAAWKSWTGDNAIGLDQAAAIPYASLGVRIGTGPEQLLVLAEDANGSQLWLSGSKIAITTRGGRIVATSGLGADLSGGTSDALTSARGISRWKRGTVINWVADFADLGRYSVPIQCKDEPIGTETISILGKDIVTLHVVETCTAELLGWTFSNDYWVDENSGSVWRSIQHIHPKLDPLATEVLRPAVSQS